MKIKKLTTAKQLVANRLLPGFLTVAVMTLSLLTLPAYGSRSPYFVNAGNAPGTADFQDTASKSYDLGLALSIKDIADREKQQNYYNSQPATIPYDVGSGDLGAGDPGSGGSGYYVSYGSDGSVAYVPNLGMNSTYIGQMVQITGTEATDGSAVIINTDQAAIGDTVQTNSAPAYTVVSSQQSN